MIPDIRLDVLIAVSMFPHNLAYKQRSSRFKNSQCLYYAKIWP